MGLTSKHFSENELRCRGSTQNQVCPDCKGLNNVKPELLQLAEAVRELLGKPMNTHSVFRCVEKNLRVHGSPQSKHLYGLAMDFHVNGMNHKTLYQKILHWHRIGLLPLLGGLGLYDWGVHIDARYTKRVVLWDHRKKKV